MKLTASFALLIAITASCAETLAQPTEPPLPPRDSAAEGAVAPKDVRRSDAALSAPRTGSSGPTPKPKPDPGFEVRTHWQSVRSDGTPYYEVTLIDVGTQTLASRTAALRDWRGDTWELRDFHDFSRKTVVTQITHIPTGEYLRLSYEVPLEARTRLEALAEFKRKKREGQASLDEVISVETRDAARTALASEWRDPESAADWKSDIRLSLTTRFLDGVERMTETLFPHDLTLTMFTDLVRTVSHAGKCDESGRYSKRVELKPDCAFDKALGYACSAKQIDRIEQAEKKGFALSHY